MNEDTLIPLTLFIVTGIIIWKYIDSRHKESQAMIEKGMAPIAPRRAPNSTLSMLTNLKWALIAICTGGGFMLGIWLHNVTAIDEVIILPSTVISGGIGLLIFYFIASRKLRESEAETTSESITSKAEEIQPGQ